MALNQEVNKKPEMEEEPALDDTGRDLEFALVCLSRGLKRGGRGWFCLDKGNYTWGCGMPQRRVVNKQSNLITVTSYTPFRHQREVGLGKMFEPHRLFVPVAVGLGRARADWGAFHVSRGLKHLLTASDTF